MILDLSKLNLSQQQTLNLLDDLEQIESTIAQALRPAKLDITPDERDLLKQKLRSTAAQLNHLAHQIHLNL